jgi:ribosomal-protein-alanine N-acetyltransferase
MKKEKEFEQYLNQLIKIAKEEGYESLDEAYVKRLKARFFGRKVIIGETERLLLREMKISDLEAFYGFFEAEREAVLEAFLKETKEASEEHLQAYIAHMYPMYDYGIWTVEMKDTEEILGICGLGQMDLDGECCTDLGYYICPKCRKQGYASECIEFVLDYAKNYLEFSCIYAIIKEENRISKGILRKFGFERMKKCEDTQIWKKNLME